MNLAFSRLWEVIFNHLLKSIKRMRTFLDFSSSFAPIKKKLAVNNYRFHSR